jgi:hypothetical protein
MGLFADGGVGKCRPAGRGSPAGWRSEGISDGGRSSRVDESAVVVVVLSSCFSAGSVGAGGDGGEGSGREDAADCDGG